MSTYGKEVRIGLAIQAYKQGQFKTPTAAAKAFDVSTDTLIRRLRGTPAQQGAIVTTRLLTTLDSTKLVGSKWVSRFTDHHDEIKSKYNRTYGY
jgi:hypothetical protein